MVRFPTGGAAILHVGERGEFLQQASSKLESDSRDVSVTTLDSVDQARSRLESEEQVDCLVCEAGVSDDEWRRLVCDVREQWPATTRLVLASNTSTVEEALSAGASDVYVLRDGEESVSLLSQRLENVLGLGSASFESRSGEGEGQQDNIQRDHRPPDGMEFTDLLLDTIEDVFYMIDANGDLQHWNEKLRSVTGYSDEELAEMNALDFFAGEDEQRIADVIAETIETGSATVEADFVTKDGEHLPFEYTGALLTDPNGEVQGVVGIGRDVAERKERIEKLEQIRQNVGDVVWMSTPEKNSMDFISDSYEHVWGRSPESLLEAPQSFVDAVHEADRERVKEALKAQQESPEEYDETYRVVQPDGEIRWVHDRASGVYEDGELQRVIGVAADVTERKKLEAENREKANLLDHIFNQVPAALYVKDEEGQHLRMSDYDLDPEQAYGKTDPEIYGETDFSAETFADDMRVIEEGERIENKEEYNPNTAEWTLTSKVPWRDEAGEIQGLIGVSRLITEKKEYEQELKLKNRAMEEAPVGITIHDATDPDNRITYVNTAFEQISGYDEGTVREKTGLFLTGSETDPVQAQTLKNALDNGEAASLVLLLYQADGTPFWGRVSFAPVTDEDGGVTHLVGFLQDVTDTKRRADEIERRLDEFGELLAEELRTPLQAAEKTIEALEAPEGSDDLSDALRSVQQVDKLIDDLATVHSFSVTSRDVFDSQGANGDGGEVVEGNDQ